MLTILIMVEIAIIVLLFAYLIKISEKENLLKTITLGVMCMSSILLILWDFFEYGDSGYYDNVIDLAIADEVMLYTYSSDKRTRFGLGFAIFAFSVNMLVKLACGLGGTVLIADRFFVMPMLNLLLVFAGAMLSSRFRFLAIKQVFGDATVASNVHEYVRFLHITIFLLITILCFCSNRMSGISQAIVVILSGFCFLAQFSIVFIKSATGKIFLLKSVKEKVEEIMKNSQEIRKVGDVDEEKARMRGIYDRIVRLMLEKKLFLDGDFDMDDLSRTMFCNKLYLSKTINTFSGKNFRQFINYYRICHAMEIIKKEPRKKLADVAEMSGFHSTATFNMAFKMNTGETPTDWIEEYLAGRYRELTGTSLRPSNWLEQAQ
jgi:AraC-like DNA-binding protein